jgi:hypothetical protein
MLVPMKNSILNCLLIPALMFAFAANAGFYKGLDEEGNVVYSDKPFENSKKITPPAITVMDPTKVIPKAEAPKDETPAEFKYTQFDITAPTNEQTIWNEPDLYVKLKLTPALNTDEKHNIWLLMDGKPLIKNSQSLSLPIGRADRGAHQIQAQVRDKDGKIIIRTRPVLVHIKNTVVPKPAPKPAS